MQIDHQDIIIIIAISIIVSIIVIDENLSLGDMQAIIRVLELPPRLSCRSRVSLLSL